MKNSYKKIAAEAAREAGDKLLWYFERLKKGDVISKAKHDIVTPADLASEKIILRAIKKNFPNHNILSEEGGQQKKKNSEYLWVVDPLDGTTNFAMGNPLFSISIGLFKNNEPILGVIYVPILNNLYTAKKGIGAFLNNKKIQVSKEGKISNAFLTFCHGSQRKDIERATNIHKKLKLKARDIRQIGSAAIECAWVAQGKVEAIIIPGVHVWDIAAGALLVREAGGNVTDINGKNWNIYSNGIIASNKAIKTTLSRTIKSIK
ncbi:hypothetical protein A2331_02845 [Candidatus Falkowbacteria bacterium RIFOXYB2_FULL_34_18]|uniref:Inositol-1-monophosphatase n=1 Tax=Candidatus Falkowbacteria bacterium RIFOXYD2_FULL_34_120 TaxID=1798007 RepID=A0A1F5TMM3_9BACT|nr:MAG: hypothetical protein A2331_02845 [Candidatus Falkowbacteria bacterium RIFOXYB2_FULL_34_18]OGF28351.1 MAG: hypothetical protein A2500_03095 [Candidatus Falkowbacteria bacterium RIFOXYC12_FULL_34_55]OGF37930.1 MAG: hypothetical protein A2466_05990 [Candidatus Falkowbacteria bacterium RIFOXYC2_FULL_34_220]OGF39648.1 MAG: hypothetical protein A2515_07285 [Candidatus Falkowbacteria bacterium RIFOXYD12_FULL_34_57]OGF40087.1 MAG: hypothetical protein A2531_04980 [Candidatus Falkowbacteria bact